MAARRNLVSEIERVNSFTIAAWLGRRAKLTGFGAFRGTRFDRLIRALLSATSSAVTRARLSNQRHKTV
jgi:hypothetical protein